MSLLLALSPFNFNDLLTGKELAHWLDWQGKLLDFNPADEVDVSIIFHCPKVGHAVNVLHVSLTMASFFLLHVIAWYLARMSLSNYNGLSAEEALGLYGHRAPLLPLCRRNLRDEVSPHLTELLSFSILRFLDHWRPPAYLIAEPNQEAADQIRPADSGVKWCECSMKIQHPRIATSESRSNLAAYSTETTPSFLRSLLLSKYGHFLKAWRTLLDKDRAPLLCACVRMFMQSSCRDVETSHDRSPESDIQRPREPRK